MYLTNQHELKRFLNRTNTCGRLVVISLNWSTLHVVGRRVKTSAFLLSCLQVSSVQVCLHFYSWKTYSHLLLQFFCYLFHLSHEVLKVEKGFSSCITISFSTSHDAEQFSLLFCWARLSFSSFQQDCQLSIVNIWAQFSLHFFKVKGQLDESGVIVPSVTWYRNLFYCYTSVISFHSEKMREKSNLSPGHRGDSFFFLSFFLSFLLSRAREGKEYLLVGLPSKRGPHFVRSISSIPIYPSFLAQYGQTTI